MRIVAWILSAALVLNASAAFAYDAQGSGKISSGNCTCKTHCDQFAKSGQLAGPALAQCKADCEQKYAGCNKGSAR
ncbi:hypothetical protein UP09_25400 [Bradyrhizobium sp. LTSP885]|uniref:hypothetical protein n=1 Tax=Bradyrhizobium sp. LTSP885 TaxID=1619232 RepID=UPI0005CAE59E|nr:hypothetical protein [Bradyrhizobium sp. LTSP885]KJC39203.1 hypothetical protein UP09_25400 [Bradyrhizobium sp. LTSP885]